MHCKIVYGTIRMTERLNMFVHHFTIPCRHETFCEGSYLNITCLHFNEFFRCLTLELKREKIIEIFKLIQVSVIALLMFGLSLVSIFL